MSPNKNTEKSAKSTTATRIDPRQRIAAPLFRLIGPLVAWAIRAGLPADPNVLLTVVGRRTGRPHTTPVAMLQIGNARYLQASFGNVNWVRNLQASGEAIVERGRKSQRFTATELPPETAGLLLRDALAPFHRSGLLRTILGPTVRPPAAVLYRFRFRIDETLEEYVADARRHPLFELRPRPS